MGNCAGGPQTAEEREAKARSEQIDKGLKKDKDIIENTIKILLLGAGESGKSTVVKQMKIIHGDGYQREELETYKSTIHDNLLTSMRTVINGMNMLSIALASKGNEVSRGCGSALILCALHFTLFPGALLSSPATCLLYTSPSPRDS